jgi:ABC-type nitrate/sulfonate/bicarbonate transport system ATPase subunit
VRYRGAELNGANPGTAMVFQKFALMPWLTVQDNVELGLTARGTAAAERRARALKAIDMIGLNGDVLQRAWVMVYRNDGAPGIDGTTLAEVKE